MADHPKLAAVQAELSAAADASGAVGTGTFGRIVIELFRSKIDSEEERDALIDGVLSLADLWVAKRYPGIWPLIREGIRTALDEAGDKLPDLLPL